jgi:hypothetical protein
MTRTNINAAETVLGLFGFDRTVYGMPRNNRKKRIDALQKQIKRIENHGNAIS